MKPDKLTSIRMDFEDNDALALLSGEHNHYLAHIEKSLDVTLDSFGNSIKITGPAKSTKTACRVIEDLYKKIHAGAATDFDKSMVDDVLRWVMNGHQGAPTAGAATIDTWKKKIVAKTKGQNDYLRLLRNNEVVFGLGPAGTQGFPGTIGPELPGIWDWRRKKKGKRKRKRRKMKKMMMLNKKERRKQKRRNWRRMKRGEGGE